MDDLVLQRHVQSAEYRKRRHNHHGGQVVVGKHDSNQQGPQQPDHRDGWPIGSIDALRLLTVHRVLVYSAAAVINDIAVGHIRTSTALVVLLAME